MSNKILITGSGGREHCIGWKLQQDNPAIELFFAPGNAGTSQLGSNIGNKSIPELISFAKEQSIDLTIVGAEDLLAQGIVDQFQQQDLAIFGPHQAAAQLESSKTFSKDFMQKHGVKTAAYQNFNDYQQAQDYLDQQQMPIVIKASGLAAGKGVIICQNREEANTALREVMVEQTFGSAGNEVVIEEYLEGFEISILSVCSGTDIVGWQSAMDHKQAYENDTGPNTGGMGVVTPHPFWNDDYQQIFDEQILQPTSAGLAADGLAFSGFIFFGLMVTPKGMYLLEYNLRLGDPETQAILPLLESNLLEIIQSSLLQKSVTPQWKTDSACVVIVAAEGYPASYVKGTAIENLSALNTPYFLAGVTENAEDSGTTLLTNGGRILCILGLADDLASARQIAYENVERLALPKSFYRKDIGLRINPLA
jgi:phosphoribosylamine--glycine ligase